MTMLPLTAYIILTAKGVVFANAGLVIVYERRDVAEREARDSGIGNRVVEVKIEEA